MTTQTVGYDECVSSRSHPERGAPTRAIVAVALTALVGALVTAGAPSAGAVPETPKVTTVVLHRHGPSGDGPVLVLRTTQVRRSRGDRVQVFRRPGRSQELIAAHRVARQRWKLSPSSAEARQLLRNLRHRVVAGHTARVKAAVVTALPIGTKISRFELDAFDVPFEAM